MLLSAPPPTLLSGAALFLDLDGTLIDLAETPDAVEVGEELRPLLARLGEGLGGRVAIISGRASADVLALLAPAAPLVAGSHGSEHPSRAAPAPERGTEWIAARGTLREVERAHPGVLLEEKPLGFALHYRRAPAAAAACEAAAATVAARLGLVLQPGKKVVELKPASADKGRALRDFMAQPPFAGSVPVMLGDDLTDEAAFAAAAELGGAGILVGDDRATAARYGLPDVAAVQRWLAEAAGLLP